MTEGPTTAERAEHAGRPDVLEASPQPDRAVSSTVRGALGLTSRPAAVLAWMGGWVSGGVVLWVEPADRFVRSHAAYALVGTGGLMLAAIVTWGVGLMMAFVTPWLFRTLTWLSTGLWGLLAVVWVGGLVQAARGGRMLWLPVVSRAAERLTSPRSTPPVPQPPL